jgi:tetratricopeptide (TPR) repeat protein
MDNFIDLYGKIKQRPYLLSNVSNKFVEIGMQLYSNTNDISTKEFVLSKLIEFFPNEPGFYYYMGFSLKDTDPERAYPFFKKSYDINPHNSENLIDLCNILNERGDTKMVLDMHNRQPFGDLLKDIRVLTLFVQAKYKEYYYRDCLNYLLYIIKEKSKQPSVTKHDKEWKQSSYLNAGHLFSIMGEHEKSIQYTAKSLELCNKFGLDLKFILGALYNLISLSNYTFVSNEEQFKNALQINNYLPNIFRYNFNVLLKTKIRVGYVSSDFLHHAVSNFILPILKNYDRSRFEIVLFHNQKAIWYRYKELDVSLVSIFNLSKEDSADLIYNENIDILFDLNGLTENSRLDIFSLNPAPIQISYLGYPNTTGLKSIKYRITDSISDPLDSQQQYTEQLLRMPNCFLLYDSVNQSEPLTPRKTKDIIILGALNNEKKTSKYVLHVWKKILKNCLNTKMLIKLESYDDLEERQKYYMNKFYFHTDRIYNNVLIYYDH